MLKRQVNMAVVAFILLCANFFYKFSFLGPIQKGADLLGIAVIIILILLHLIYAPRKRPRRRFNMPLFFIFLSLLTSSIAAYYIRDQSFVHSILGQSAIYFYLLYYLLHELEVEVEDLENVLLFFGFTYIAVYLLQYLAYPRVLVEAGMMEDRGTLRIFLPGYNFVVLSYYFMLQRFLRTNKIKFLFYLVLVLVIVVLRGGRQSVAMFTLVTVLFVIIDRQVRSRMLMIILGAVGAVSIFLIFQSIFMELLSSTQRNLASGDEYVRIRATRYFLTDFIQHPVTYISGNGVSYAKSAYGREIAMISIRYRFFLGDIGLVGNYVMYGIFFVIAVFGIIVRALRIPLMTEQTYLKYMFFVIAVTLVAGGGFGNAPFVSMIACLMYIIDQSNEQRNHSTEATDGKVRTVEQKE